ncbi:MAG: hypothetical protein GXP63_03405 [DPANN group archaeon]|nr:hypothetical protein [DPANN group archaeon]
MRQKAQVSMEYLMVIGFALLMVIPVILVFFTQTETIKDSVNLNQARTVAREIAENVETVAYLGKPAMTTIKVTFPDTVKKVTIGNREISLQIETAGGLSDIFETVSANVSGTIAPVSGIHHLTIEATSSNITIAES